MTRLLVLRHAESEWNARGLWQGVADPPLSPRGERQARVAGRRLLPMAVGSVVSSDLRRARSTAAHIARELTLTAPIGIDADLREYDVGAWSGLTRPEIEARWPGAIDQWRQGRLAATPGGENYRASVARLGAALNRVAAAARPGATVAVITHGGVMSAFVRSLGEPPRRFTHLAGLWIDRGPEGLHCGTAVSLLDPPDPEVAGFSHPGVLDPRGL